LYAVDGDVRPGAEIEEAAWVDATALASFVAPSRATDLAALTDASG
jgi:hypothetical protein